MTVEGEEEGASDRQDRSGGRAVRRVG